MTFSSLDFLFLFLPVCTAVYYLVKNIKWKNAVLLVFSLLFYSLGEPVYIILLIISSLIGWALSLLIAKKKSRLLTVLGVLMQLVPLCIFKYLGFIIDNLNLISSVNIKKPELVLPVGISFYCFQIIAYLIDVYREKCEPAGNYFEFLLFISMFPQLVQGPILRYPDLQKQLQERKCSAVLFVSGLNRFLVGLGKKAIFATELSKIVEYCFAEGLKGKPVLLVWLGILSYSLQLYYDFSGYSDMALGLGNMFGFEFKENFNYPYVSRSASEFWRRWHISLGAFFRDYVYIPLGGNRKHQLLNLFAVWALTGLWHGAAYNFILWGLYFFILLSIEKFIFKGKLEKIPVLSNILTIFILLIGWTVFYFTDMETLVLALKTMFGFTEAELWNSIFDSYVINNSLIIILAIIGCVPVGKQIGEQMKKLSNRYPDLWFIFVLLFDAALLFVTVAALVNSGYSAFLYARF